ncbi:MAG: hypothetical protein DME34_04750 [Verrucomicrobia bacterium]|nr:MAG: hypothetical protein DME34_04750 [Verrucomicrobiota bacterium]
MRSSTGIDLIDIFALSNSASKALWLKPRSRSRAGCSGTGTMRSKVRPRSRSSSSAANSQRAARWRR